MHAWLLKWQMVLLMSERYGSFRLSRTVIFMFWIVTWNSIELQPVSLMFKGLNTTDVTLYGTDELENSMLDKSVILYVIHSFNFFFFFFKYCT